MNFEDSESSMEIGDECPGTAEIKETTEQVRLTCLVFAIKVIRINYSSLRI